MVLNTIIFSIVLIILSYLALSLPKMNKKGGIKYEEDASAKKSKASAKKKTRKTAKVKALSTPLVKHEENPLISPNPENRWESSQTFNPGSVLIDDEVHFLYRAVGDDAISRIGYAVSDDGLEIKERMAKPAYQHKSKRKERSFFSYISGGSWGGAEDPRIVRVGDEDRLYMTYTSTEGGLRVALTSIKVEDFKNKKMKWAKPAVISNPYETHKNWVVFPEKINGKYAILHSINPKVSVEYVDSLDFTGKEPIKSNYSVKVRNEGWDKIIRGAGPPPIKTKEGWLLFYHAIDRKDPDKYKVGAMILDFSNPTKVLYRSKVPVLEPNEVYENNGFKGGIVYASGAVVKNGRLMLYYGGADSYVCAASANLNKFLKAIKEDAKPEFKVAPLRK